MRLRTAVINLLTFYLMYKKDRLLCAIPHCAIPHCALWIVVRFNGRFGRRHIVNLVNSRAKSSLNVEDICPTNNTIKSF